MDADIIGLQEVRHFDEKTDLLDIIGGDDFEDFDHLFCQTLRYRDGKYGNALVSRFPINDHVDIDLGSNKLLFAKTKKSENRRAILAKIDIPMVNRPFWALNTHLAVQRRARYSQFDQLMDTVVDLVDVQDVDEDNDRRDPMVWMGDFNEWRSPKNFIKRLDDLFDPSPKRRSFPSRFPILPLDRLWVGGGVEIKDCWVPKTDLTRLASDHLPIVAEVKLN
jgi:endonuclease/exonuclease/phosphatase family metal-dependent hydrolase